VPPICYQGFGTFTCVRSGKQEDSTLNKFSQNFAFKNTVLLLLRGRAVAVQHDPSYGTGIATDYFISQLHSQSIRHSLPRNSGNRL
jgi:hypothetical protein